MRVGFRVANQLCVLPTVLTQALCVLPGLISWFVKDAHTYAHEDSGLWFSSSVVLLPGFDIKVVLTSLTELGRWEVLFLLCLLEEFV